VDLVDSHCHIHFSPLRERLGEVVAHAREQGVRHMLCVSVSLEDGPAIQEVTRRYDGVYASVGVHPNETEGREPSVEDLVGASASPQIVAIGETGLDYFRSQGDLGWQRERFARHIAAAREVDKPLIVHTRDSGADTVDMLKGEGAAPGVLHCFTDTWEVARAALDLGYYISFSGIVTFRNADPLREVARRVPLDRLLVETDAPYLAPVPHRGKANEPAYTRFVAQMLAEVRGADPEELAGQTTENFFRLFKGATRHVEAPESPAGTANFR